MDPYWRKTLYWGNKTINIEPLVVTLSRLILVYITPILWVAITGFAIVNWLRKPNPVRFWFGAFSITMATASIIQGILSWMIKGGSENSITALHVFLSIAYWFLIWVSPVFFLVGLITVFRKDTVSKE